MHTSGNEGFRCSTCRFLMPVTPLTSTTSCTLSRGKLDLYIYVAWTQSLWLLAALFCCMQNRKQTLVKASNSFNSNHKASQEVCAYLQQGCHADCLESPVVLEVHSEVPHQPLWVLRQLIPGDTTLYRLHGSAWSCLRAAALWPPCHWLLLPTLIPLEIYILRPNLPIFSIFASTLELDNPV